MQMLEGFLLWQDWEGKQLACWWSTWLVTSPFFLSPFLYVQNLFPFLSLTLKSLLSPFSYSQYGLFRVCLPLPLFSITPVFAHFTKSLFFLGGLMWLATVHCCGQNLIHHWIKQVMGSWLVSIGRAKCDVGPDWIRTESEYALLEAPYSWPGLLDLPLLRL